MDKQSKQRNRSPLLHALSMSNEELPFIATKVYSKEKTDQQDPKIWSGAGPYKVTLGQAW